MSDIKKEVGFNIRRIREEKGLTQGQLSTLTGLHRVYIGHIEWAEKNTALKNLEKTARALQLNLKHLLLFHACYPNS